MKKYKTSRRNMAFYQGNNHTPHRWMQTRKFPRRILIDEFLEMSYNEKL